MSFLAPMAFWIAAAAMPALVILYFLKMRRREEPVASTLLWKRAVRDLEVNSPFQRLRRNLLLLLQLIVLALAIVALARPMIETPLANAERVVILLDRSASMNAAESDGRTRLELAKEQGVRLVRSLNRSGSRWLRMFGAAPGETRAMVIAFGASARIVAPFTANTSDLASRIEAVEPSDEPTNIREALQLAEAYMTQTGVEPAVESGPPAASIVLLSDGAFASQTDVALQATDVSLVNVAETTDNAGITSMRYLRNYENPERLNVLVQVENFGPMPIQTDVSLYVAGRLTAVRSLELSERREVVVGDASSRPSGGRVRALGALSFDFALADAALIEARLSRSDALDCDNRAYVLAPPPRKLSVLLVSDGNLFLEAILPNLPLARFDTLTPAQYESAPPERIEAGDRSVYDVVVFDKHATERLPAGNYLFIAAAPPMEGVRLGESIGAHHLLWWDEAHPILHHAALEFVVVVDGRRLEMPDRAEVLVEGPAGPVLARIADAGRQHLILSFAIEASTWWSKRSFGVFLYNAIRYLGGGSSGEDAEVLRPGDTIRLPAPPGTRAARLTLPDGATVDADVDEQGMVRFAATSRVGVYALNPGLEGRNRAAVNLESASESDLAPRGDLRLGQVTVKRGEAIRTATPEIWRWFVAAALLVVLAEWLVYTRRVSV